MMLQKNIEKEVRNYLGRDYLRAGDWEQGRVSERV